LARQRQRALHRLQRHGDPAGQLQREVQGAERLQRERPVVERFGLRQHFSGDALVATEIPGDRDEIAHLVRREQRASLFTGGFEQRLRLADEHDRGTDVAAAPREEAGEMELRGAATHEVVGGLRELFDRAHRADRDRHARIEAVFDHPLGLPSHGVEHVEPAPVSLGQHLEQRREQPDRLPMVLERLGLAQRTAQRVDGLRVTAARRAHECCAAAPRRPDCTSERAA